MHAINKIVQDVLNENLIERINFYQAVQAKVKARDLSVSINLNKTSKGHSHN